MRDAWPAPNEIGRKLRAVLRRVGIGSGGPQSPGSRERAPDVRGQLKSCTGILILEPSALCVAAKTGGAQRFLMDRRPLNALEDRLVGVPLPFVGDFVRIELGPNEIIRTSLRDGKDQYYVMDLGDARIGNPVDPDWFPDADLPGAPLLQLIVYASSI